MLQIHELDDPIKMCINFAGNFFVVALAVSTYAMQHFYPHLSTKFLLKQCKMWGTIFGSRFSWAGKSLHMARRIQFQVLSKIVSCHLLRFTMKTTLGAVLSLSLSRWSFEKEHLNRYYTGMTADCASMKHFEQAELLWTKRKIDKNKHKVQKRKSCEGRWCVLCCTHSTT